MVQFTIPFIDVDVDTEEPKDSLVGLAGGFAGLALFVFMYMKAQSTAQAADERTGGDDESSVPEV